MKSILLFIGLVAFISTLMAKSDACPRITFPCSLIPNVCKNMQNAISKGRPTTLNRITDRTKMEQNRRNSGCPRLPKVPGQNCDEYPFASSRQGGAGAEIMNVPSIENSCQGGLLAAFYRTQKIGNGDCYRVALESARCPTIIFPCSRIPNVCNNMRNAISMGRPTLLTRITDPNRIAKNRRDSSCPTNLETVPGESCHGYPFASSMQGGEGAVIVRVPSRENEILESLWCPTITFPCSRIPNVCNNMRNAISMGRPTMLTRITDPNEIAQNRRDSGCPKLKKVRGESCHGYPFASSMQGGEGAVIVRVPSKEIKILGGFLGGFYRKQKIGNGGCYKVALGP
ncbi:uncharacterized protein LOC114528866 isoform X2 [Dendronephthya gigantea]|uniref:uncharacterized protein LOC114528866 isoform X2 n=1 Tax=Dendronephthya gigantea TaxID=151771 RepID=UPI00106ABB53|nr:uncharacterized protein LOC114528866 isoform X2 [Dendronephthya gigantea]